MTFYFHVYYIDKKLCKFYFSFLKSEDEDICGDAVVYFGKPSNQVFLKYSTHEKLSQMEINEITSNILRNINY